MLRHSFAIGFDKQMFGADEQVSGTWSERLTKRSALIVPVPPTMRQSGRAEFSIRSAK